MANQTLFKSPEKVVCHECGATIPVFEDLSESDERRVRECIRQGRPVMAMTELKFATGCSLDAARLWVEHRGIPQPAKETRPCPYCGQPLRTSLARQCRFCGRDWHYKE